MKKYLILMALCALMVGHSAADPWVGYTKISEIYPYSGGLIFRVETGDSNLSSCEGKRFSVSLDHPNYQVMSSAIMLAFASGKEIYFNVDGHKYTKAVCDPTINRLLVR